MLVTAEGEGRVRLWDARSTLPVASIDPTVPRARVAYAGFTARAGELVVVEEKVARLFLVEHDRRRGFVVEQRARLPFLNTIWSADVSPRQGRLAVGAVDGSARLIELETLRLVGSAMKHDGVVVALGFSPDGQWLVSRTEQATRVWDARTGYPVADTVRHDNRVAQSALMGEGTWLATVEQGQSPQALKLNLDFPAPYASWLPGLVEWAGRGHLDRSGAVAPLEDARAELARLGTAVAEPGANAWWTKWGNEILLRLAGAAPANEGGK
jgi:WD40 repeat protein